MTAAACGGTTVTELSGPNPVRCLASFSTPAPTVPAAGGSARVTVSAQRECTWSAQGGSPWIQVSPTSGQGESTITITASANPDARPRSTDLVVNDQRLSIRQEPAPCVFGLSAGSAAVPAAGGSVAVSVSTLNGCDWSVTTSVAWVHVLSAGGSGSGGVSLRVDANAGAARTAQLSIAGESFTIAQNAFAAPPPPPPPGPAPAPPPPGPAPPGPAPTPPPPAPPPPANCSYSIDPRWRSVSSRSRSGEIDVRTSNGCAWTASSNVSWMSITSGASSSGDGEVKYRIDENDSRALRWGTLSVAGQTFTVFQSGDRDDDD